MSVFKNTDLAQLGSIVKADEAQFPHARGCYGGTLNHPKTGDIAILLTPNPNKGQSETAPDYLVAKQVDGVNHQIGYARHGQSKQTGTRYFSLSIASDAGDEVLEIPAFHNKNAATETFDFAFKLPHNAKKAA